MHLTSHDGKTSVFIVAMGVNAHGGGELIEDEQCMHLLIQRGQRPVLEGFTDLIGLSNILALQDDGRSVGQ